MSTETASDTSLANSGDSHDAGQGAGHGSEHSQGWTDKQYILLAAFLAVVTALEVYASYADWLGAFFIPSLIFMMLIKFVAVVLFFMHLRFDNRLFSILFYTGIGLALMVYIGTLLTFEFFVN
jgi:cytochrome c oxidase subunit 4